MQFSDTTNETGLLEVARKLLPVNANDFTAKDGAVFANIALDDYVSIVIENSDKFQFDGTSHSDIPIAYKNIVANQQQYTLTDSSTEFLVIDSVSILDSNGNIIKLKQVDVNDSSQSLDYLYQTSGIPEYFDLKYNSIYLYPSPNYSKTDGLIVEYRRNVEKFVYTDTTKEPPIPSIHHPWIAHKMAYMYAQREGMGNVAYILDYIKEWNKKIALYYGSVRNKAVSNRLSVKSEDNM